MIKMEFQNIILINTGAVKDMSPRLRICLRIMLSRLQNILGGLRHPAATSTHQDIYSVHMCQTSTCPTLINQTCLLNLQAPKNHHLQGHHQHQALHHPLLHVVLAHLHLLLDHLPVATADSVMDARTLYLPQHLQQQFPRLERKQICP
jgi:hypothetical protein